jgi:hypothetical protein
MWHTGKFISDNDIGIGQPVATLFDRVNLKQPAGPLLLKSFLSTPFSFFAYQTVKIMLSKICAKVKLNSGKCNALRPMTVVQTLDSAYLHPLGLFHCGLIMQFHSLVQSLFCFCIPYLSTGTI